MAPPANARQNHPTSFIQAFTKREHQKRVAKQRPKLTAEQHAALRQKLKESSFLNPDYADNTKIHIAGILRKWKKYVPLLLLYQQWLTGMEILRNCQAEDVLAEGNRGGRPSDGDGFPPASV